MGSSGGSTGTVSSKGRGDSVIVGWDILPLVLAAALLLWPAFLNGYPLVFSDTGTYLSQIPHHYLGWDRPPFYSAFLFATGWDLTTWSAIGAQGLVAAWVLDAARRGLAPALPGWSTPALAAVLAVGSPLPWVAAELMPDLFTGLMAVALILLALRPERFGRAERYALVGIVAFSVAAHLGNLPIALGVEAALLAMRLMLAGRKGWLGCAVRPGAPVLAAVVALCGVNLVGRGRPALAPYGDVFLLARLIADGPAARTLQRDCPRSGWRLCAWRSALPRDADTFLWDPSSPLALAGGPKALAPEAGAIIAATLHAEPWAVLRSGAGNTLRQLEMFATGDGLQAWPATVAPWIAGDFPRFEQRAYRHALQTGGRALVPPWMGRLHRLAALVSLAASIAVLPWVWRRDRVLAASVVAALLALVANAAVTGALSGPHDRYQSRVMWLPELMVMLALGVGLPRNLLSRPAKWIAAFGIQADRVLWCAAEAAAGGLLSFASAFVLARLIGASELGIGAGAAAVHVLLWVGTNAVLADAIVQRPRLTRAEAGTAMIAGAGIGLAGALLQAAALWPLRAALGDPRLTAMCLVLALPLPLVGLAGPVQGLLTRGRDYRRLALRTVLGQGCGLAVGLVLAAGGGGAWAVVMQQAVTSAAGALLLLLGGGWQARLAWRPGTLLPMFRVGLPLAGSTLVLAARYRVFALLVGAVAGPAVLGQVHMAFRLVETVRELASTALWRLLLPPMAERQHDRKLLLDAMDRALRSIGATLVPLCAVLAVATGPIVAFLLGPHWAASARAAVPLAALAAWMFATFPSGVAAVALGAPKYGLRAQAGVAALAAFLVLIVRPGRPEAAALVWVGAHGAMAPYAVGSIARVLGCSVRRTLAPVMPALAAAAIAGSAGVAAEQLFGLEGLAGGLGAIALAAGWVRLRPPALPSRPRLPARS